MPVCASFLDILRDQFQRLIGKALKPQDARTKIVRGNPQIEREYLRFFGQQMQAGIHTIDVVTCAVLVAKIVQGHGHEAIGQH